MQRVLLAIDHDGVPSVVPAVEFDHVVDGAAEQIGRLPLAFVAPLGADQHDRRHGLRSLPVVETRHVSAGCAARSLAG